MYKHELSTFFLLSAHVMYMAVCGMMIALCTVCTCTKCTEVPEQTLGGIPLGLGMVMKINFFEFS